MEEIVGAKILRQESVSDVSGSARRPGCLEYSEEVDEVRQKRREVSTDGTGPRQ